MRSPGTRTTRQRRVSKNRPGDPFYSSRAWKRVRDRRRALNPCCEECERKGFTVPMDVVDHIKPRRDHPKLELELSNTQSLCIQCHNRKTGKEMQARR
ncbi:MAG: HNH endonuclease signature motif containing protein [Planctomycetota bacterium]